MSSTLLVAWSAGINGYATLLILGLLPKFQAGSLPDSLLILAEPVVLSTIATLYALQFLADKIPGVDCLWDAIHTLVRIPLGVVLTLWMIVPADPVSHLAVGMLGAIAVTASHLARSGFRLLGNVRTLSVYGRWLRSLLADVVVAAAVLVAVLQPAASPLLLCLVITATAWLLLRIAHALKPLLQRSRR